MKRSDINIKRLIEDQYLRNLPVPPRSEKDAKTLVDALRAMKETIQKQSAVHQPNVRRVIMKSKIWKLAAAAIVIIAVLAGLPFFGGKGSGVALADVLERIEQVQAFMYRMKMTMTGVMQPGMPAGKNEMEGTITISNDYGMKMETTMADANSGQAMSQQMYFLPDQKVMISLMPEQKKYMRMEFDDDMLARMKKQNNDPREMIKQIMNCEYFELGRSVIDGVKAEGFQTKDSAFLGGAGIFEDVNLILCVDVEKWLPLRAEMYFKMSEQMEMSGVVYDYQWDVQVDASEFEPVIPEDFTAFPAGGMKMPSMTEEAAIDGLKFFAEMSGQYPKKLNLMSLMQEFAAIEKNPTDSALKVKEEMDRIPEEERMKKTMEMMRPVQSLGMFYMTLVQDRKEPAYYGEFVGPNDTDMVLMRWKVSDNEYRVIFGDLTVENVSLEQLKELEAALPEE
ncbi:MAG: hypothetical protein JXB29_02415 [Sedimentisphaerales bacterium]|nr:hypothetical protein [Sedimentisphaerales bacterium]